MAAMSNYLEAALLNAVFRNTTYTSPVTCYIGLFVTSPGDDASGTEVSGTNYARQVIAFDAPGATDGLIDNTSQIDFPAAGAGGWTEAAYFGIFDAIAGNLLVHGQLTTPKTAGVGDIIRIPAGDIDITFA